MVVKGHDIPADWSIADSALANGIAAIKSCHRANQETAITLLRRGLQRLGMSGEVHMIRRAILEIAEAARDKEPRLTQLADRVVALVSG